MSSTDSKDTSTSTEGRRRGVLAAIAVVAGLAELAYAVMNVSAMPVYLKYSMGYGEAAVTSIGTAFLLCEGLLKSPFGAIGDRIGRKRLIIAGPLISAFTSLLTLRVHPDEWYFFVFLRVLDGFGAAALWTSALAMIADVVDEDRRSQAMSLFNVTYLVGVGLGPLIGGAANDLTAVYTHVRSFVKIHGPTVFTKHIHERIVDPHRTSFYVISVLFLLTALVAWLRLPDILPHHKRNGEVTEGGFSLADLVHSLRQIPQMLLIAFVTFLGIGLVMLIIKLFAMAEFGVSETQFGALLLVPCLVIALASMPLGTLGDRWGKARAVRLGMGLCAFSMWALILMKSEIALVIGGSLIGVGFVIAFPSWMAYVSASCDPGQRGAVMGAVGTAQGVGAMVGAPLGGYLYEHAFFRLPFVPERAVHSLPFLSVTGSGTVGTNPHYTPFIACALLLVVAWALSVATIRPTPPPCP